MKRFLIIFIFILLFGCAGTKKPIPDQDIYFLVGGPHGQSAFIQMPKGFLDDKENWLTEEEYQKMMDDFIKQNGI